MPQKLRSRLLIALTFLISAMTAYTLLDLGQFARAAPPIKRPNVLIILADDMGFSDAGCYGGEIHTPNIDRLAARGLRFTDFHNTARCWPSRAALLSGYYAQQVRRDTIPNVKFATGGRGVRPSWARLLPEMLKPLGYRSYHSGKWHIDGPRLPAGFDHSYSLEDPDRYFTPKDHLEDDVKLPPVKPEDGYYSTTAIADHAIKYLRQHHDQHGDQPFFMYLAFTSPHYPLQAPAEDIARYKGRYTAGWDDLREERLRRMHDLKIVDCALSQRDAHTIPSWNFSETELQKRIGPGEVGHAVAWDSLTPEQQAFQATKMSIHAAMVDRMDQEIGRVLAQIAAMGAEDDTLVLFLSDNGASAEQIIRGDGEDPAAPPGSAGSFLCLGPGWSTACNTPLRLHKSWVHEGGISTPLIMCWPNRISAKGELRRNPGHLVDVVPTILDLIAATEKPVEENPNARQRTVPKDDVAPPPKPGTSLAPVITRDNSVDHEYLWWFHDGHKALRLGNWKAVSLGDSAPWELYDLHADRSEMHDLAKELPERVDAVSQMWRQKLDEFRRDASSDLKSPQSSGTTP